MKFNQIIISIIKISTLEIKELGMKDLATTKREFFNVPINEAVVESMSSLPEKVSRKATSKQQPISLAECLYNKRKTKATRKYGMTFAKMAARWGGTQSTYSSKDKAGTLEAWLLKYWDIPEVTMRYFERLKDRGGHSKYPLVFKVRRVEFVRINNNVCHICGKFANSVHHKDMNTYNNEYKNFMLLCHVCHGRIHTKYLLRK